MEPPMVYHLPREIFLLLREALGDEAKAEKFAQAIEGSIQAIDSRATEAIVEKKQHLKGEIKEELRTELVTRELFEDRLGRLEVEIDERFKVVDERFKVVDERFKTLETKMEERFNVVDERFKILETKMEERFKVVDEKFKSLNFKFNLLIAITLIALTLANPQFIALIERIFKL